MGEKASNAWEARPEVDMREAVHYSALVSVLFLSLSIRLLNFPWGVYLSEFDPFWHYRCALKIVDSGLTGLFEWRDMMSWYPAGRLAGPSTPPGLPLTAAAIYWFLNFAGIRVDLLDVTIHFPPFAGMLTALAVYLLGREVHGRTAGLFGALFVAFSGSHIERTYLGFFKHETVGVLSIVVCTWLFLKAVRPQPFSKLVLYSVLCGLWLGYLEISWTAYIFEVGLLSAFPLILLLLGRNKDELLPAFAITQGLAAAIALQVPRPGVTVVTSMGFVPVLVAAAVLSLERASRISGSWSSRLATFLGIGSCASVALIYLSQGGLFTTLLGKLVAVLDPLTRLQVPIIESVAEHKMSTWYSIFSDHGFLPVLAFFGVANSLRKPTNGRLMASFAWVLGLYFASLMVRIGLILSPFMAVSAAIGLLDLAEPAVETATRTASYERGRRGGRRVEARPELAVLTIVALLVLAGFSTYLAFEHAGVAVTIAGSSLPVKGQVPDWLDAVSWIRGNTPPGSVILSWWDYGYWITTMGERPTLADNATINSTQIAAIGRIFMSNDTAALPLLKKYNVSYVLVFTTIHLARQGIPQVGEEVKWVWMAEIGYDLPPANVNETYQNLYHRETLRRFADFSLGRQLASLNLLPKDSAGNSTIPIPKGESVLTRLMVYGAFLGSQNLVDPGPHFEIAFRSTYGLVLIYRVRYDVVQDGGSASAYSQANKVGETEDRKEYSKDFGPGWTVSFTVEGSEIQEGWANETHRLRAGASIEISGPRGSVSWEAEVGEHKIVVGDGEIRHYVNGQLRDAVPNGLGGSLRISLGVKAENSRSFESPASAELRWGSLTFSPNG
ncbi:MAG: glycosyltransferase family 39 protein [Candidatus Brockarchaeota archaeon]|nr:glycosyltransferase family 39 protein [Candidatus Brockarchaeota archaeon]